MSNAFTSPQFAALGLLLVSVAIYVFGRRNWFVKEVASFLQTVQIERVTFQDGYDPLRVALLGQQIEHSLWLTQITVEFHLVRESILRVSRELERAPQWNSDTPVVSRSPEEAGDYIQERRYCFTFLSWNRKLDWKEDFVGFCELWYADIETIRREDASHQEWLKQMRKE